MSGLASLYPCRLIVECRECGKLLTAFGQWEDGEINVMTSGSPVFGKCPSKSNNPKCGDWMAHRIFLSEQTFKDGSFNVWVEPEDEAMWSGTA